MRSFQITAADGFSLAANHYDAGSDRAVVIASAMGVKRRYYDAFAQYLCANGISVLTFDYRGIGDSRPRSLRGFEASLEDWGKLDIAAAIEWMSNQARSISYVGHSVGGQLAGMVPNIERAERLMFVCAQTGHWRDWPGLRKIQLGALWLGMPVAARAFGFFPAKMAGLGSDDLPRGVALEWSRWGRHRDYLFGYHDPASYARIKAPLLAYSFRDDHYAPRAAVELLLRRYESAAVTHIHVEQRGLGHFDYFRRGKGEHLWPDALAWLTRDRDTPL